jgi:hypothetical protein
MIWQLVRRVVRTRFCPCPRDKHASASVVARMLAPALPADQTISRRHADPTDSSQLSLGHPNAVRRIAFVARPVRRAAGNGRAFLSVRMHPTDWTTRLNRAVPSPQHHETLACARICAGPAVQRGANAIWLDQAASHTALMRQCVRWGAHSTTAPVIGGTEPCQSWSRCSPRPSLW